MKSTIRALVLMTTLAAVFMPGFAILAQDTGGGLESEEDKVLYALGVAVGQPLGKFGLTADDLVIIRQGFEDAVLARELKVDLMTYGPKVQAFAQQRMTQAATTEKAAGAEFVEKMAAEEGAVKTDSGLVIKEITAGTGESPKATDKVRVHYHGTLRDGTVFDSSVDRGEPVSFPLSGVIPCWTEGVQMMKVGGKSKLTCSSDIAYGDQGRPPTIPGGAVLVFEVELLEIEDGGSN